jgi:hypothetical protein
MKVSKRQLRRIIREERTHILSEQGSWNAEDTQSPLLDFVQAWNSLGGAVQEQVTNVLASWNEGGHEPDWSDTVYEQNPAAISQADTKLTPLLKDMHWAPAETLMDALEEAMKVINQG